MAVADLDLLCHELLDACEDILAATVGGTPARSYVAPGQPANDCEQLTVHAIAVTKEITIPVAPPPATASQIPRINLANLFVTVFRCVVPAGTRVGSPPSVAQLESASEKTNQDVWAIWNGVMSKWRAGDLFEGCDNVHFDGAISQDPSGGFAGWTISFRISLNGYNTETP